MIDKIFKFWTDPAADVIENIVDMAKDKEINTAIEITPYENGQPKLYRPFSFDEYIGQDRAKNILKAYITATQARGKVFPHTIIYGKAGCGKTTLAKIIAHELKVKFSEIITSTLNSPAELIVEIGNTNGGIIFLDEIHSIPRDTAESIYMMMEDFTFNGIPIKPFTLIGATTEIGELMKDRRPFVDRFKIPIELEDYQIKDMILLLKQYQVKSFPNDYLKDEIFDILARNARVTPRIGIRLLEATIYLNNNVDVTLKNFNILKDGFTNKDLKILKYIALHDKGIGLPGIVSYMETSRENYEQEIEPWLLKNELIIRTPRGRKITDKGKEQIKVLEAIK